jgi:hypothetical protein
LNKGISFRGNNQYFDVIPSGSPSSRRSLGSTLVGEDASWKGTCLVVEAKHGCMNLWVNPVTKILFEHRPIHLSDICQFSCQRCSTQRHSRLTCQLLISHNSAAPLLWFEKAEKSVK